jgi:hypothetical protein
MNNLNKELYEAVREEDGFDLKILCKKNRKLQFNIS